MEEEVWLIAAQRVLRDVSGSMHYTDIKRAILDQGLVSRGLKVTLEAVLFKEVQKPDGRFKLVEGKTGVFALAVSHMPEIKTECAVSNIQLVNSSSQVLLPKKHEKKPVLTGEMNTKRKYAAKYKHLRRHLKHMIFMNAAVCDEVIRMEEKIARVKQERRFLLRKLVQQKTISEVLSQVMSKQGTPAAGSGASGPSTGQSATLKSASQSVAQLLGVAEKKKKKNSTTSSTTTNTTAGTPTVTTCSASSPGGASKKTTPDHTLEDSLKSKSKKAKPTTSKRLAAPIPLDKIGRPIFPIELGSLTVHCLGEVIHDRQTFHSPEVIYPAGFCSTRPYVSMKNPELRCLYTCKISDEGNLPKFEISPEDMTEQVITGPSATACHRRLLQAINQACGVDILPTTCSKGADFFGLSHPSIQNLIQSLSGARKCNNYRWIRFEVSRDIEHIEDDVTVSLNTLLSLPGYHQALIDKRKLTEPQGKPDQVGSGSLRSLLTSLSTS